MALRDRLASKALPTQLYPLLVENDTEAAEALAAAEESGDEERIKTAKAAHDGCYEWLRITALPPVAWEKLVAAHPPTAEQVKADPNAWCDYDAFGPAMLAACIEGDETAADWAEFLQNGPVSAGEVAELVLATRLLNERAPGPHLGKG